MSAKTKDEIVNTIRPNIITSMNAGATDKTCKKYTSPLSGVTYTIMMSVSNDADKDDAFIIMINNEDTYIKPKTLDEAYTIIAEKVATNMMDVKKLLLNTCADLGLASKS